MTDGIRKAPGRGTGRRDRRDAEAQLAWVAEVLNESGLGYWADSGTLLGLVRDGRLLPGDPDIDLGIWSDDEPALRGTLEIFRERGYRVRTEKYRDLPFNHTCVPPFRSGLRRIDVYVYRAAHGHAWSPAILPRRDAGQHAGHAIGAPWRFLLRGLWARVVREVSVDAWPWDRFFAMRTWWIPRGHVDETGILEGVPLRVPARWEEYLSFRYGDWRVPATRWSFWSDDGAIRAERPEAIVCIESAGE